MKPSPLHAPAWMMTLACALNACATEPSSSVTQGGTTATGGSTATTGGSATGGTIINQTGGTTTGGTVAEPTGGTVATATGGAATGGSVTMTTGGSTSGGVSSGGTSASGGMEGTNTGGTASGGAGGSGGTTGKGGSSAAGGAATSGGAATTGGATTGTLCPANAVFCEDFEDGNLDGWTTNLSGGTLLVNAAKPSHGTSSLQIDVPAMQYGGALIRKGAPLFPLPTQRMWGRLMIYFDTIADGHTDFIRGAASNGATPQYNVAEQHGEIMLNYYAGAASDCWARPKPGKVVPLKAWMCWEWAFDGAANQMQFYIDGTLSRQVDATGDGCLSNPTQTWVAPTFAELRIGEYIAERSPSAQRIWIDDIAVGTNGRIPCPAP